MKAFPVSPIVAVLLLIFIPVSVRAQSPGAAAANEAAYALFSAGDYAGAATAYQAILKDYPTDGVVPVATIQLAFSQYLSLIHI